MVLNCMGCRWWCVLSTSNDFKNTQTTNQLAIFQLISHVQLISIDSMIITVHVHVPLFISTGNLYSTGLGIVKLIFIYSFIIYDSFKVAK